MSQISIFYKLKYEVLDIVKPKNDLTLNVRDYFSPIKEVNFKKLIIPYKEPESKFSSERRKWELDCIYSKEWRNGLKLCFIEIINENSNAIIFSKENPKKIISEFYDDYKSYDYVLIDRWLKYWTDVNLENETLENLILYNKSQYEFIDEKAVEAKRRKLNKLMQDSFEDTRAETRYWNNSDNSYREGGGGDEWSDPSKFW